MSYGTTVYKVFYSKELNALEAEIWRLRLKRTSPIAWL